MTHIKKKYVTIIVISLAIFLLDRFTKYLVLDLFENITVTEIYINHFINLLLIWNDGIAFGLLNFSDQKIYNLITIMIFFVSTVVLIIALKSKNYDAYFFSMIFGDESFDSDIAISCLLPAPKLKLCLNSVIKYFP